MKDREKDDLHAAGQELLDAEWAVDVYQRCEPTGRLRKLEEHREEAWTKYIQLRREMEEKRGQG